MLLVFVGRLAQFALAFVTIKLMTTLLTPVEVGKVTLVTTATAFFALFLVNPVGMFINRRLVVWAEFGSFKHYFHLFCIYLMAVAVFAATITWILLLYPLSGMELSPVWGAALIAGSLLFNTINQTLVPSFNLLNKPRTFVILTIATLAVGLVISVTLVEWFGAKAVPWLAGPILCQAMFSYVAYRVFFPKKQSAIRRLERADFRRLFDFAWPISIGVGLSWLQFQGYRFVLADQFGLADLGLFAAGYGIAASLSIASETVTTTWFQPKFYRDVNAAEALIRQSAWSNYANTMLPFTALTSSGIVMTAPYLTTVMLGPSYQSAVAFVMMGALAEWGRTVSNVFGLIAYAGMNTRRLILPNLLGVFVCYLAMYAPITLGQLLTVPIAVLAGSLAMSIFVYQSAKTSMDLIDWRKLFTAIAWVGFVCLVFAICRRYLLPALGHFEPYGGLILAIGLWVGIAQRYLPRQNDPLQR